MQHTEIYAENGASKICDIHNLRIQNEKRNPNGTINPTYYFFECDVRLQNYQKYYLNIDETPVKIQVIDYDPIGVVKSIKL